MHTDVQFQGEDGEGSACSREDAPSKLAQSDEDDADLVLLAKDGGKNQNSSGNSSLARLLQPPIIPMGQGVQQTSGAAFVAPSTGWTSQYSDPNVSTFWHQYYNPADAVIAQQAPPSSAQNTTKERSAPQNIRKDGEAIIRANGGERGSKTSNLKQLVPEGSGSNPTGNGSSGNDSVHPTTRATNGTDILGNTGNGSSGNEEHLVEGKQKKGALGRQRAPGRKSVGKDGSSDGNGSDEAAQNGSGDGSNQGAKNGYSCKGKRLFYIGFSLSAAHLFAYYGDY